MSMKWYVCIYYVYIVREIFLQERSPRLDTNENPLFSENTSKSIKSKIKNPTKIFFFILNHQFTAQKLK